MVDDPIFLDGDVIAYRIIVLVILPCVNEYANRGCHSVEANAAAYGAYACANRLKNESDAIGTIAITTAKVNVELEVERFKEADLIDVPHRARHVELIGRKRIAVTRFLEGVAVNVIWVINLRVSNKRKKRRE